MIKMALDANLAFENPLIAIKLSQLFCNSSFNLTKMFPHESETFAEKNIHYNLKESAFHMKFVLLMSVES
jgi:hypothetical protein